jgi:hypothetical protein
MACFFGAMVEKSIGWLIGSILLFCFAEYARRQLKKEAVVGRGGTSTGFLFVGVITMLLVMGMLFFLQFKA